MGEISLLVNGLVGGARGITHGADPEIRFRILHGVFAPGGHGVEAGSHHNIEEVVSMGVIGESEGCFPLLPCPEKHNGFGQMVFMREAFSVPACYINPPFTNVGHPAGIHTIGTMQVLEVDHHLAPL
ncbi:hypothetical protein BVX97_06090 [bacterium E08(2017)]|nr:hypothetical protein BVX97_06090 [bacterium E08(2017)]